MAFTLKMYIFMKKSNLILEKGGNQQMSRWIVTCVFRSLALAIFAGVIEMTTRSALAHEDTPMSVIVFIIMSGACWTVAGFLEANIKL
jgi:hypothetical protein